MMIRNINDLYISDNFLSKVFKKNNDVILERLELKDSNKLMELYFLCQDNYKLGTLVPAFSEKSLDQLYHNFMDDCDSKNQAHMLNNMFINQLV